MARALLRSRVTSDTLAHPVRPALTHHQQKPEEGQEVAGLGGLQPEEVHADDGEHDHEEPWAGVGVRAAACAQPSLLAAGQEPRLANQGTRGPGHRDWHTEEHVTPAGPGSAFPVLCLVPGRDVPPLGAAADCELEGAGSYPWTGWREPRAIADEGS